MSCLFSVCIQKRASCRVQVGLRTLYLILAPAMSTSYIMYGSSRLFLLLLLLHNY